MQNSRRFCLIRPSRRIRGHRVPPWRRARKRRLIQTEKYYLFDVGLVRALRGMPLIQSGTEEFGRFFEHFLIEEIRAYLSYRERNLSLSYWRTSTGLEVDLIIGNLDLAVEFKTARQVRDRDLKGLLALREDQNVRRAIAVTTETTKRRLDSGIEAWPWQDFCRCLWADELV